MKHQKGFTITELLAGIFYLGLIFGAIGGYVLNIVKLWDMVGGSITGELILRGVGVFVFPVGCVLGWV